MHFSKKLKKDYHHVMQHKDTRKYRLVQQFDRQSGQNYVMQMIETFESYKWFYIFFLYNNNKFQIVCASLSLSCKSVGGCNIFFLFVLIGTIYTILQGYRRMQMCTNNKQLFIRIRLPMIFFNGRHITLKIANKIRADIETQ